MPDLNMAFPSAARTVAGALAARLMPPARVNFATWIGHNIVLVDGPLKGQLWRAEGAPYLKPIAECLSEDHPSRHVVVRKSQQTGVSILGLAWAIYLAEQAPDNILYAVKGDAAVREMNGRKLQPLIDAYEARRGQRLFRPTTLRSGAGSTTYEKRFPGGYMALGNSNTAMDLSGHTLRWGIEDELSKWEDIPGYGDPEELFLGRFTAFLDSEEYKILSLSTPETDSGEENGDGAGHCRIDRKFRRTNQQFWHIPCPHCHEPFVQDLDRLQVNRENPEDSMMACPHCGALVSERQRRRANREGHFAATAEGEAGWEGFHVDAFCSTMMNYGLIARQALEAEKGNETKQKAFWNLVLGLPYRMRGDAPDHVRLHERRENYPEGVIPSEGLILVAGADVGHHGIHVEVVAFGQDRQSWSVFAHWLPGATDVPNQGAWKDLEVVLDRQWTDNYGRQRKIMRMAVDVGDGGRYPQTLIFAQTHANVMAIKGVPGWGKPALSAAKEIRYSWQGKKRRGPALYLVGTWDLKSELYAELHRVREPGADYPAGYCHHGQHNEEDYFRQLTAEYLATRLLRGGGAKQVWEKNGPNHFGDCRIYAKAVAIHVGLDRMTEDQWAKLRAEYGAPVDQPAPDLFNPAPPQTAAPKDTQTTESAPKPRRRGVRLRSRGVRI